MTFFVLHRQLPREPAAEFDVQVLAVLLRALTGRVGVHAHRIIANDAEPEERR